MDRIGQRNGLKDGTKLVKTVRPFIENPESQVEFAVRRNTRETD